MNNSHFFKPLEAIEKLKPSIVFLDIELPAMNGFEMLEQFDEIPFAIIFTTSYDQYAIKAIRFSALPAAEQFQILLDHVQHKETGFKEIAVPTSEGFELIPEDEILRCEADDNYTHIFLKIKTGLLPAER